MKNETLEAAAENYFDYNIFCDGITDFEKEISIRSYIAGAKMQAEQNRWKTVYEETPASGIELLVQSPEGIVHISSWREAYSIFACQAKSESSNDWKWKTI